MLLLKHKERGKTTMNRKSIYSNIIDIFNSTNTEDTTLQRGFNYRLIGTKNSESLRLVDDNNKNRNVEFYAKRGALYFTFLSFGYKIQTTLYDGRYYSGMGYTVDITMGEIVTKIVKNGLHRTLKELEEM